MDTIAKMLLMTGAQKRQPILFVGSNYGYVNAGGSLTVNGGGSMKAGDLMIVLAFSTSTTVPTTGSSGWTTLHTKAGASTALAIFGKVATGTSEAIQITNGYEAEAQVLRYAAMATPGGTYGAVASTSSPAVTSINLPALTLTKTDGTSRVLGFITSSTSSVPTGYAGMTALGGYIQVNQLYTTAAVSSWSALSGGLIGAAADLVSVSLEILRS